jgi:hypothetical protein
MGGCSKPADIKKPDIKDESQKVIDELKSQNAELIEENNKLSQEADSQKKLLELRNFLDVKFYYLLYDMRHDMIDENRKEITSNITVSNDKLVSQLPNGPWNFKFPEDDVQFRERSFFLKDSQAFEAIYEVWDPEEERLLECYVDYVLVDTVWKFNSIFIDGKN